MHYVHNLPAEENTGFFWTGNKKKSEKDYREQLESFNDLQRALHGYAGPEVYHYVLEHLDLEKNFKHIIFSTPYKSYVKNVDFSNVRAIINFKLINKIKKINEHFRSVNTLLPDAGIYIGRLETYWERKIRFCNYFGNRLGKIFWLVDFILSRIIPKLRPLNKLYPLLLWNKGHVISQAEILGRLVYNGFDIIDYKVMDGLLYFAAIKTKAPKKDPNPSYHPIITLNRVGKHGKMIKVYKLRTMHPYSEYLQDFVIKLNGYNKVGKPANDFRVARWGKVIRKLWIDEIPQILNVLKGDMKIVGIRPISRVRYNEFPEDLRIERIKYKPGCIPPYVALNMPDDKGNIEAERVYLRDKARHPYLTDIIYLCRAVYNIATNKIRSS